MQRPTKSREIRLASRPAGWPGAENFTLAETELRELGPSEVLVRNTHMSVEPYMRGRMNDVKSYLPPFEIGKPLEGAAVGFVVASNDAALPAGTWVQSNYGWRESVVAPAKAFTAIDASVAPPTAYLGILGVPGFTAWIGLHVIAQFKPSDVVFVSSAAGAVGSAAGQFAKLAGATVIGSAGSPSKVAYLREKLGFDAAFDYHNGEIERKLREAAPNGIDVYFDNVGGEQLEAALSVLKPFGRVAECGMISAYNEDVPGPRTMMQIVGKRLTLRGFIIIDHFDRFAEFRAEVAPLLRDGKLIAPESYFEGIERAPDAFGELLRGGSHLGKIVVRLAPEGTAP